MNPPLPQKRVSQKSRQNPPRTFKEAVAGLVDRPFLKSGRLRNLTAFEPDRLSCVEDDLLNFVGRLRRKAAKMGIPLYAESGSYEVVFISHARRRRDLFPIEWEVIAHLGGEIARQYGLPVAWGGPEMPSCWMVHPRPEDVPF